MSRLGTVPLTTKANLARFTTWDSLNATAVRIAVSQGTVFDEQARKHFPLSQVKAVQAPATGYQEVLAGRADATITSNVEASTLVQRYDQLSLLGKDAAPREKRPFAYVVAQDDPIWLNYINTWVSLKRIDGLFDDLETKWLAKS